MNLINGLECLCVMLSDSLVGCTFVYGLSITSLLTRFWVFRI